jgi:2-phospho-L-lactate transferase/gluconeogenesis factor (CofD/UPF0052 family)
MTKPGETCGMTLADHVSEVIRYLGQDCLDYVIYSSTPLPEDALKRYRAKDQEPVYFKSREKLANVTRARLIEADVALADDYLRHDSAKLAAVLKGIFNV